MFEMVVSSNAAQLHANLYYSNFRMLLQTAHKCQRPAVNIIIQRSCFASE